MQQTVDFIGKFRIGTKASLSTITDKCCEIYLGLF